jgi:hypothetical protein
VNRARSGWPLAAGISLVLVISLSFAEAAPAAKRCGRATATNGDGATATFAVRARHLGCSRARSVIRRFWRKTPSDPGDTRTVRDFRCVYLRRYDPGAVALRCTHSSHLRRWAKGLWIRRGGLKADGEDAAALSPGLGLYA